MMLTGIGAYTQAKAMGNMVDRYGGPVGLAGKIIGLGQDELRAGIPWWSWLAVGGLAGGFLVYSFRHRVEKVMGD